jgi:LAO/AO transport system kinase
VSVTDAARVGETVDRIRAGDRRALARAISAVERGDELGDQIVGCLFGAVGSAQVVGITGPPGAGKSTLTSSLVRRLRMRGSRVGVVSVDPSSPFSGGALLGDRLRMSEHLGDEEVFVRSMASRGSLGGLSLAAPYAVALVEAWGANRVLLETVGVGQSEIDVAAQADAVVLVLNPATGDSIQALKSGVMEIPDLVVVNVRGNVTAAEDAARQLRTALQLGGRRSTTAVLAVDALLGTGMDELVENLDTLRALELEAPGATVTARARRLVQASVRARVDAVLSSHAGDEVIGKLADGQRLDVMNAVVELLRLAGSGGRI